MYAVFHPELSIQPWHVYVAFVLITWLCAATVIFANRALPMLNDIGLFLIVGGGLITIIVVAAMPKMHASSSSVWSGSAFTMNNLTGWSPGVAFLTGVLNGAFTIGTPDAVTHMAEELPNPSRDMPRAVAAQMTLGTISTFPHTLQSLLSHSLKANPASPSVVQSFPSHSTIKANPSLFTTQHPSSSPSQSSTA